MHNHSDHNFEQKLGSDEISNLPIVWPTTTGDEQEVIQCLLLFQFIIPPVFINPLICPPAPPKSNRRMQPTIIMEQNFADAKEKQRQARNRSMLSAWKHTVCQKSKIQHSFKEKTRRRSQESNRAIQKTARQTSQKKDYGTLGIRSLCPGVVPFLTVKGP